MLDVYIEKDPVGYSAEIEQGLVEMQKRTTPNMGCYFCIQAHAFHLALEQRNFEQANKVLEKYRTSSEDKEIHYWQYALLNHCELAHTQQKWDELIHWAPLALKIARKTGSKATIMEASAWQAIAYGKQGKKRLAKQASNEAVNLAKHTEPAHAYYTALATYYEQSGELQKAIELRKLEIEKLTDSGRDHRLAEARLDYCRLLAETGELTGDTVIDTKNVIMRLRQPKTMLDRLERLATPVPALEALAPISKSEAQPVRSKQVTNPVPSLSTPTTSTPVSKSDAQPVHLNPAPNLKQSSEPPTIAKPVSEPSSSGAPSNRFVMLLLIVGLILLVIGLIWYWPQF